MMIDCFKTFDFVCIASVLSHTIISEILVIYSDVLVY